MASYDQERRDELAQEHGFDTYFEYRTAYAEEREKLERAGFDDLSPGDIRTYLDFEQGFDPNDNDMTRDDLHDWFFDQFPDSSEEDFYDWLASLYED